MQAAKDCELHHLAHLRSLDGPGLRRVLAERQMGAAGVIVLTNESPKQPSQVATPCPQRTMHDAYVRLDFHGAGKEGTLVDSRVPRELQVPLRRDDRAPERRLNGEDRGNKRPYPRDEATWRAIATTLTLPPPCTPPRWTLRRSVGSS